MKFWGLRQVMLINGVCSVLFGLLCINRANSAGRNTLTVAEYEASLVAACL